MHLAVFVLATEHSMPIADVARAAEERGFESLWVPEHTHIPTSVGASIRPGMELPDEYKHTLDPFVSLGAAAAATRDLRLGTGICLLIQHSAIAMAKQVATLDLVSGGRFEFGIGGGWGRDEMKNHGTSYETRFRKLREQVLAMKEIWASDAAEFHGAFVDFDPLWSWPKPVQQPHPPILLGGESSYTLQRVVDYCDGWLPRSAEPDVVLAGLKELRQRADAAGRSWDTISTSVFAPPTRREAIAPFADEGAKRAILWLPPEARDATLARLDRYAAIGRSLA